MANLTQYVNVAVNSTYINIQTYNSLHVIVTTSGFILLLVLGEMHGIVGQAWCYDRWMYTLTTDHITCNNISSHTSKESDG